MSNKSTARVCSVAVLALLVSAALGPAKWIPRSGLGWQIDHFVGYFVATVIFCLLWPRPLLVGGAVMALAVILEGLQAFTPDRSPDFLAAFYSGGGAVTAVLPADFLIRASKQLTGREFLIQPSLWSPINLIMRLLP